MTNENLKACFPASSACFFHVPSLDTAFDITNGRVPQVPPWSATHLHECPGRGRRGCSRPTRRSPLFRQHATVAPEAVQGVPVCARGSTAMVPAVLGTSTTHRADGWCRVAWKNWLDHKSHRLLGIVSGTNTTVHQHQISPFAPERSWDRGERVWFCPTASRCCRSPH